MCQRAFDGGGIRGRVDHSRARDRAGAACMVWVRCQPAKWYPAVPGTGSSRTLTGKKRGSTLHDAVSVVADQAWPSAMANETTIMQAKAKLRFMRCPSVAFCDGAHLEQVTRK